MPTRKDVIYEAIHDYYSITFNGYLSRYVKQMSGTGSPHFTQFFFLNKLCKVRKRCNALRKVNSFGKNIK